MQDDDDNGEWLAHPDEKKCQVAPLNGPLCPTVTPPCASFLPNSSQRSQSQHTPSDSMCVSAEAGSSTTDFAVFGTAGQRHNTPLGHRHDQAWPLSRQISSQPDRGSEMVSHQPQAALRSPLVLRTTSNQVPTRREDNTCRATGPEGLLVKQAPCTHRLIGLFSWSLLTQL